MSKASAAPPPEPETIDATLGPARAVWKAVLAAVEERFGPLAREWKPSKSPFGRMCLLRQQKRTLLYLTPDEGRIWVAIVLGERAVGLALAGPLPAEIKTLVTEARAYAEGRGIRFPVSSADALPTILTLLEAKTAR